MADTKRPRKGAKNPTPQSPAVVVGVASGLIVAIAAGVLYYSSSNKPRPAPGDYQRIAAAQAAQRKVEVDWYLRTHPRPGADASSLANTR